MVASLCMTIRRSRWSARWGLAALLASSAACFNSDEKFREVAPSTTTGETTTTTTPDPTTTTDPSTGPGTSTGSDATCRDAIDCIFECAAAIQAQQMQDPDFEPDLSCFLACVEQIPEEEAVKLLRLGNCASEQCVVMGECTDGSDPGTTGEGGTDDGPIPLPEGPLDPCIMCIFVLMLDEDFAGCREFALVCE